MNPDFLIIDLFCGAGGTTTGFDKARIGRRKVAKVIACVNHDENAIRSHRANHKGVLHFTEDIRTLDLRRLEAHVERQQQRYPDAKLVLWASLECTNFSKAKGGQPRDADSRTLAEHLFRYIDTLRPDYIQIENVEEFMSWGPLDERGKPVSKCEGQDFMRWIKQIKRRGFRYEHRLLNSADYGAYTSRVRYFAIFAGSDLPIVWPEPTHAKNPQSGGMFGHALRKWKPVREVLDLEDEGRDIFERDKPLSEKTLQRIYAGLIKYVAGGDKAFTMRYQTGNDQHRVKSMDEPVGSIMTSGQSHAIVSTSAAFILKYFSGSNNTSVNSGASLDQPSPTTTARTNLAPVFILKYNSTNPATGTSVGADVSQPCPTVACQQRLAPVFLSAYHGNGHNCTGSDQPAPTVMAADALAKVQAHWIDNQYGCSKATGVDQPLGSLLANPKQNVCSAQWIDMQHSQGKQSEPITQPVGAITTVPKKNIVSAAFLTNHNYDNTGTSVNQPAPTLLASRRHYYIINPAWGGNPGTVDAPCCTVVARQDKAPLYLTTTESGEAAIIVYETDSETTRKIKQFMALYGIARITMRMLKVQELKRIMGLTDTYVLIGNQSKQKWMIGNMVHPVIPQHMARALSRAIKLKQSKAA